jgi:hypothetical protein
MQQLSKYGTQIIPSLAFTLSFILNDSVTPLAKVSSLSAKILSYAIFLLWLQLLAGLTVSSITKIYTNLQATGQQIWKLFYFPTAIAAIIASALFVDSVVFFIIGLSLIIGLQTFWFRLLQATAKVKE